MLSVSACAIVMAGLLWIDVPLLKEAFAPTLPMHWHI
jgi:hypothetical protein